MMPLRCSGRERTSTDLGADEVGAGREKGPGRSSWKSEQACLKDGFAADGHGGHQVTLSPEFAELCRRYVAFDIACWTRMARAAAADLGVSSDTANAVVAAGNDSADRSL
jgi:hypothetical protein